MSETAILATVCTALWGVTLALLAVVWGMLRQQNNDQAKKIETLQTQNTQQEVAIGRLTENARNREETHAQHREDTQNQFSDLKAGMAEMNRKLDTLLGRRGPATPYPTSYGHQPPK